MRFPVIVLIVAVVASCGCVAGGAPEAPHDSENNETGTESDDPAPMDRIAESYVRLVLALGEHDEGYVDAYYGPASWREEVRAGAPSIESIHRQTELLLEQLTSITLDDAGDEMLRLRREYLEKQLGALRAYASMLLGERPPFDDESRLLYDAVAPRHEEGHFQAILDELETKLPGEGPLVDRYEHYRSGFVIPENKIDTVFKAAIAEARRRTGAFLDLPESESFRIEYVGDKPWSGYNWYQGNGHSLIQINTDLPINIDRAIDLACHEGYPGHHVYNALLEETMVRNRGWMEFSVYPLYSPQSLIAEGSANFGIAVAFPRDERLAFEREVLFPLAGLDPDQAGDYYEILDLVDRLDYAGNEAARSYLDGTLDRERTIAWLRTYALMSEEKARQRVRFFDTYRSYVINYNLGKDLVRSYIESKGGTPDQPERRWSEFAQLLSSPRLPSGLK